MSTIPKLSTAPMEDLAPGTANDRAIRCYLITFRCKAALDSRQTAPGDTDPPEVMSTDQAAAFLGVDRKTVYEYANRGEIPHQRLGKRLLFGRRALLNWLEQRE